MLPRYRRSAGIAADPRLRRGDVGWQLKLADQPPPRPARSPRTASPPHWNIAPRYSSLCRFVNSRTPRAEDDDGNVEMSKILTIVGWNAYCQLAVKRCKGIYAARWLSMNAVSSHFSRSARKQEKQASRDADSYVLRSGAVSARQLSERNDFFAALDVRSFRISAIGGRSVQD